MSLEELFSGSVLALTVPTTAIHFPPPNPAQEWLDALFSSVHGREQAFFDEQLQSYLTLKVPHPSPEHPPDAQKPPQQLLEFLAHVQISLEASYIPQASPPSDSPQTARLSAPPRASTLTPKLSARTNHHPSILPPNTPNPTPTTAEQDRKYVSAQGTLLQSIIWGQAPSESSQEDFSLVWSQSENVWIVVYRLALTISFIRLNFINPLLCLTVSATLRERPVISSSSQHPLVRFLKSFGDSSTTIFPESPMVNEQEQIQDTDELEGFEEVNLLEGLLAGPIFSKMGPAEINLSSTRLGAVSRQKLFSLPPRHLPTPSAVSPSPTTALRKAQPTLRKSYRKTLETVSGFRVRMRTVFVPSVLLESEDSQDKRSAGNEERTVVLCVEVENSGEAGKGIGFEVQKVEVIISGDEAKARLITWGTNFTAPDSTVYPLKIDQWAQCNLLYAVSFMRSPEELDAFSFARASTNQRQLDLQRAVSINIHVKPYLQANEETSYPTQTFSSRWNCVLDLSAHQSQLLHHNDTTDLSYEHPNVLPEPPSPFPVSSLQTSKPSPLGTSTALRSQMLAGRTIKTLTPIPTSFNPSRMSMHQHQPNQYPRSPTTYTAPISGVGMNYERHYNPGSQQFIPPSQSLSHFFEPPTPTPTSIPMTPAYPSYPTSSKSGFQQPQTPISQGPIAPQTSIGIVGPSLEVRRNRSNPLGGYEPPTPIPQQTDMNTNMNIFGMEQKNILGGGDGDDNNNNDTVVVSVGLLPMIQEGGINSNHEKNENENENGQGQGQEFRVGFGKIYPLDCFTLDIFVFNRSDRTRRFEITCPDKRSKKRRGGTGTRTGEDVDGGVGIGTDNTGTNRLKMGYPGILPMEGRVRIGPLLGSACQSVRMEFLAISPGVHSIDALTLTDIETGFSINLRSVMDVVVHNPDDKL